MGALSSKAQGPGGTDGPLRLGWQESSEAGPQVSEQEVSHLRIKTHGQDAESGPRSRCLGRRRVLTQGSGPPAEGVCSKDPEDQAERGVWRGQKSGLVCVGGGAEFLGGVTRGVQGGGWRELHAHSLGAEPRAGNTETREGSGKPQKLSVILPDGEGAELPSV